MLKGEQPLPIQSVDSVTLLPNTLWLFPATEARRFKASRSLVRDCSVVGSTGGLAAARPAFARMGTGIGCGSNSLACWSFSCDNLLGPSSLCRGSVHLELDPRLAFEAFSHGS